MKRSITAMCALLMALSLPVLSLSAQAVTQPPQVPVSLNLLAFFVDVPEATMTVLSKASSFADEGKWASAFKVLQEFDADNADPFVLALKTEISLLGNAQTYMHKVFAFVDLEPGVDLDMARMTGVDNADPVEFDPVLSAEVLEAAGKEFPPVLYKMLGDYYFEALMNYPGQWVEDDETVSVKILENYERAVAGEAYDKLTLFRQGEILLRTGNSEAASTVLGKYLSMDPENLQARFSLAKSYAATGKITESYTELNAILGNAADPQLRNEVYMFAIQIAVDNKDIERTDSYLTAMQNENPDDSVPGLIRHLLAIRNGEPEVAAVQADSLLTKSQGDPNVVRSIVSSWLSENQMDPAMAFLDRGIARHQDNAQTLGTLYFYKSLLIAEGAKAPEDFAAAMKIMALAEENFKKVLPQESEVFATIAELMERLKQSMEPLAEEPAAEAAADATSSASEEYTEEAPAEAPKDLPAETVPGPVPPKTP